MIEWIAVFVAANVVAFAYQFWFTWRDEVLKKMTLAAREWQQAGWIPMSFRWAGPFRMRAELVTRWRDSERTEILRIGF